jgi:hypothetical protein
MAAMQVLLYMVAEAVHQVVARQAGLGEGTTLVIQPPQVLAQVQVVVGTEGSEETAATMPSGAEMAAAEEPMVLAVPLVVLAA